MKKHLPQADRLTLGHEADDWADVKILSREEVRVITQKAQPFSMVWLLLIQGILACIAILSAWPWSHKVGLLASVVYGAMCVCIPQALLTWGVWRREKAVNLGWIVNHAGSALAHVYTWEGLKIGTTLILLALAVWVLPVIQWPALLISFVLVLKLGWWVALAAYVLRQRSARHKSQHSI